MSNEMSPIDKLFDENNEENIVLYDEKGEPTEFEQVAVVSYDGKYYVILSPAAPMEGIAEDEGIVFVIEGDGEDRTLSVVLDDEIIDAIFEIYEASFDEE